MASSPSVSGSKFESSVEPGEFKDAEVVVSGMGSEFVDVEDEDAELFDAAEGRKT